MTELTPLICDGEIVPGQFVNIGSREPQFSQEMWNGEVVYSHQSGYGFLRQNQVTIQEHV